jgi:hypothetical protein
MDRSPTLTVPVHHPREHPIILQAPLVLSDSLDEGFRGAKQGNSDLSRRMLA